MAKTIVLHPFEGVEFPTPSGTGMVRFGDDLDAVAAVLGPDFTRTPGSSRITFDEPFVHVSIGDGGVEFIELAADEPGAAIELGGVDLARLDAIECARHLREVNGDADVNEDEAPASYVYAGIGVSVWQSHALQTALDELAAARAADEEPEEGIDFFEGEVELARHFEAIGLASRGYVQEYFA
ncbi:MULTISPECIES: hypothetical protein [Corynebacterium]|uniref:Uncharacterized protein n=1 Tax=Corynebacterium freneyi TaxID=134034 RepID=A0ABS4UAY1_9CORY|nr:MULTISPECIES: hypothetical protein [Corynebacterium]MBP2333713.1 hypothetical protein [Corynebacterium freneyi]OFU55642.1 hypothetical protein HMPREF3121_06150 [Corynebacterium sp. HMSC11E11]QXA52288.1 hypothetical protein I6L56_09405 [Corynebacterium freneyi]WJZ04185.1 hypothetical protein CFREN_00960 [Corynebacterium freneyi]